MLFDPTVTLGNLLQIFSLFIVAVSAFVAVSNRLTKLEQNLIHHAETLQMHAQRLDRYEQMVGDVIKELQRLIGRMDVLRAPATSEHGN